MAAWLGWLALALFLLTICALLAGLTLAICGLDETWLHLRSISGTAKQRRQACAVIKMKTHATWLLCSLIICSVACGESLPLVMEQKLWPYFDQMWVSILISTFSIAIFAEILPQCLIPRQAIAWGYYCSPLIWGCMFVTAIVSIPLAWLLDHLPASKDVLGVFTSDQLALVIKYHERSEKRGGMLGQDATRVMLGALKLDNCTISGKPIGCPEQSFNNHEKDQDIERGSLTSILGIIMKWSAVKTVDINDTVDESFIRQIKGWSYTRIPVIGRRERNVSQSDDWEGTKIFGFLHVKNLIGIDNGHTKFLVKDLPLSPLPIVKEDMSIYELLNMFQCGISRMVIVVAHPLNDYLGRNHSWTVDYLKAVKANAERSELRAFGIRSPQPLGIVTFGDLIDTMLQKTSRDENCFLGHTPTAPPWGYDNENISLSYTAQASSYLTQQGTMRRRNISKDIKRSASDGPANGSADGISDGSANKQTLRRTCADNSSYTHNSQGGFHDSNGSGYPSDNTVIPVYDGNLDTVAVSTVNDRDASHSPIPRAQNDYTSTNFGAGRRSSLWY